MKHRQYLKIGVYWSDIPNRCYYKGQSERKPKHLQVMVSNSNNCCKVVITLYGVMDVYSPFGKFSRLPLRVNASVTPCFWNSGFQALVCYFVDVGVIPWVGVIRNLHKRKKRILNSIQLFLYGVKYHKRTFVLSPGQAWCVQSETVSFWFLRVFESFSIQ